MLPDEPTETETTEPAPTETEDEAPAEEQAKAQQDAEADLGEEEKPEGEEPEAEGEAEEDGEVTKADAAEPEEKRRRGGSGWQRQRLKMERLERQNQILAEQLARNAPPPPAAKPEKDKTAEEKAAEYVDALVQKRMDAREAEQRQKTVITDFQRRTAEVRATKEDFDDVVSSADIPVGSALGQVLLTSERGPDIMYQLAKSPAELARISALPPLDAAREVGWLEAKLAAMTPSAKPTNGTAKRPPAPPTSVRGTTSNTRSLEDLPVSDYKRAYRSGRR